MNNRIDELDVLKGIGILLMILDHSFGWGQDNYIHSLIQSFHMPLFFIVSGYLWKKKDNTISYIQHKTRTLLFPHFNFAIIYSLCFIGLIIIGNLTEADAVKSILALFAFSTRVDLTKFASPIWFLQALFIVEIVFEILKERTGKYLDLIIVLIGSIGIVYSEVFSFMLPFALEPAFTGLIFFWMGVKLKRKIHLNNLFFLFLPVWIILVSINGCVDMRSARYYNPVLYIINGVLGTLIVWNISRIICCRLGTITKFIKHFSVYSITYLCIHYIFIYYGGRILDKIIIHLPKDLVRLFLFICVITICWIINKLIIRYIPWIIARPVNRGE